MWLKPGIVKQWLKFLLLAILASSANTMENSAKIRFKFVYWRKMSFFYKIKQIWCKWTNFSTKPILMDTPCEKYDKMSNKILLQLLYFESFYKLPLMEWHSGWFDSTKVSIGDINGWNCMKTKRKDDALSLLSQVTFVQEPWTRNCLNGQNKLSERTVTNLNSWKSFFLT